MVWQISRGSPLFLKKEGLQEIKFYRQNFIDLIVLLKTVFMNDLQFNNNSERGCAELSFAGDIIMTIRLERVEAEVVIFVESGLPQHFDFLIHMAAKGAKLTLVRLLSTLELTKDMEMPCD